MSGKSMLRWGFVIAIWIALPALCAGAQATPPPPLTPVAANSPNLDPAYVTGYKSGFDAGRQDAQAGMAANPHKFQAYQDGNDGYTAEYGAPEVYHAAYQSGFTDGYGDGFAGRPSSLSAGSAPAPGASDASPDASRYPAKVARGNGYHDGYTAGQTDANQRRPYNAAGQRAYHTAMTGYDPSLGNSDEYQTGYRDGFNMGYEDGYNLRLYNTAIGLRPNSPAAGFTAASGATPGADMLPTDPEALRAKPAGIYANGILIAAGTSISTTLNQDISTKTAHQGDTFTLTVTVPVWVGAVEAIPAGSTIHGTVSKVVQSGKMSGTSQLQLTYNTVEVPGRAPVAFGASTSGVGNGSQSVNGNEGTVNGQSSNGDTRVARDAGVGAAIGGIFGGYGGLLRGAIAGTVVGAAGVLTSKDKVLVLHTGEPVTLHLDQPLALLNPPPAPAGGASGK